MRNVWRKMSVLVAGTTVGVLTLGGAGVAWASTPVAGTYQPGSTAGYPSPPTLSGTVTAVAATSFVLKVQGGPSVVVTVNGSTVFAETGAVVQPTGVSVGEQVTVTPTGCRGHQGFGVTAERVLVVLSHVVGTVESVGTGSFVLQLEGGLDVTVATSPATAFRMDGTRQSGVEAGQGVTAYGASDPTDPSELDAEFVVITPTPAPLPPPSGGGAVPLLSGTVGTTASGSFVFTEAGGTVLTVDTTPATTYGETGEVSGPVVVASGDVVRVTPTATPPSGATSVTAARVVVVLTQVTGTVESVGSHSFTLQLFGGLVLTVATSGTTVYAEGGTIITGITTGQKVTAYGAADPGDPSQLDAQFVDVDASTGPGGPCGGHGGGGNGWGGQGW
jgi:Domain of unknown function (DUF5666)